MSRLRLFLVVCAALGLTERTTQGQNPCYYSFGSSCWPGNPITVEPGQSSDFHFSLQRVSNSGNCPGWSECTVTGSIVEGSEYVEITDPSNIYVLPDLPCGTGEVFEIYVNLRATVPPNDVPGSLHPFVLLLHEESGDFVYDYFVDMCSILVAGDPPPIPTVSEWALVVMTLLVLTAGTLVYERQRRIQA